MSKSPIYLSFATQKGGVGKSTFTVLAASWLNYVKGYNVAIIDCDYPQNSIAGFRARERESVGTREEYKVKAKEQVLRLNGKKAYPVVGCSVQRALQWINDGKEDMIDAEIAKLGYADNLDVVLFDVAGTMNQSEKVEGIDGEHRQGILTLMACMDYVFCPMKNDRFTVESSLKFANEVQTSIIGKHAGNLKRIYLYWTEIDKRENLRIINGTTEKAIELGFDMLNTRVWKLSCFNYEFDESRNIFKSTIFPAAPSLARKANIDVLVEEICEKINLQHIF
jgi:cellulose biosynthesis protein BcsQ